MTTRMRHDLLILVVAIITAASWLRGADACDACSASVNATGTAGPATNGSAPSGISSLPRGQEGNADKARAAEYARQPRSRTCLSDECGITIDLTTEGIVTLSEPAMGEQGDRKHKSTPAPQQPRPMVWSAATTVTLIMGGFVLGWAVSLLSMGGGASSLTTTGQGSILGGGGGDKGETALGGAHPPHPLEAANDGTREGGQPLEGKEGDSNKADDDANDVEDYACDYADGGDYDIYDDDDDDNNGDDFANYDNNDDGEYAYDGNAYADDDDYNADDCNNDASKDDVGNVAGGPSAKNTRASAPSSPTPVAVDTSQLLLTPWEAYYVSACRSELDSLAGGHAGYDKNGYDKDGYDRDGFDKNGYDGDGYDLYEDDRDGYAYH